MKSKPIRLTGTFRLTGTSFAVMALLDHLGEATPYDLKQALEHSVQNFWAVPHTTFYAEPDRLAKGGYLTVQQEPGGRRRKLYSLTDGGRDALREWAASPVKATPQLRDEGMLKIFAGADPGPIFAAQRIWHVDKLAELQGYLDKLGQSDTHSARASRATLMAGLAYHRQILDLIDAFLSPGAGSSG